MHCPYLEKIHVSSPISPHLNNPENSKWGFYAWEILQLKDFQSSPPSGKSPFSSFSSSKRLMTFDRPFIVRLHINHQIINFFFTIRDYCCKLHNQGKLCFHTVLRESFHSHLTISLITKLPLWPIIFLLVSLLSNFSDSSHQKRQRQHLLSRLSFSRTIQKKTSL